MQGINRTVVVVGSKQPFIDWLRSIADDDFDYTLEQISADNLTFLIPQSDNSDEAMEYIRKRYDLIFEWAFGGCAATEELWSAKRNWKMLDDLFDIEIYSEVFD
ncbi:MAG: hypothetical protein JXN61_18145 [Sedimentisphaerales bacterium]|nr:hypothetical protein [Sedimentisphaerales bacterium]